MVDDIGSATIRQFFKKPEMWGALRIWELMIKCSEERRNGRIWRVMPSCEVHFNLAPKSETSGQLQLGFPVSSFIPNFLYLYRCWIRTEGVCARLCFLRMSFMIWILNIEFWSLKSEMMCHFSIKQIVNLCKNWKRNEGCFWYLPACLPTNSTQYPELQFRYSK